MCFIDIPGIVFQRLEISSSISLFDRQIFNNFVATVIREASILVIFNVFIKYYALRSGGRSYFDFW